MNLLFFPQEPTLMCDLDGHHLVLPSTDAHAEAVAWFRAHSLDHVEDTVTAVYEGMSIVFETPIIRFQGREIVDLVKVRLSEVFHRGCFFATLCYNSVVVHITGEDDDHIYGTARRGSKELG